MQHMYILYITLVAFVWLFSAVHFQVCPQVTCLRGCIFTLVAFVWLLSTVRFQMSPQSSCLSRHQLTLVAFVLLFSTMHLQMVSQSCYPRRRKVTLVALVFLVSTVRIHMVLQFTGIKWRIVALAALVGLLSLAWCFQWNRRNEIILVDNTVASLLLHCWLNLSSFFCDLFVLWLEKWKSLIIFKQGEAMYWCYKKWAEKSLLLAWCWGVPRVLAPLALVPLAPPTMSVENKFVMWRNFRFLFMTDLDLVDHVFLQVNCMHVQVLILWWSFSTVGAIFSHNA